MSKIKEALIGLGVFVPSLVSAQVNTGDNTLDNIGDLLATALHWINAYLIPLLIAVAVIVFFWGIVRYISGTGQEEKRKEARNLMIWGIVALFVMVSVWGLVKLLQNTLGIENRTINPPCVPAPGVPC